MARGKGHGWLWWAGLISLAAFALAGVGYAVLRSGRTVYTDADTIRQPARAAHLREILWQPPRALELPEGADPADTYEPAVGADGAVLVFVRRRAGENADLYAAVRTPTGWSEPQALEGLNSAVDDLGPAFSPDGQRLYFYSNRPGGCGGYDLWAAERGADGAFGVAQNLGYPVNTALDEYSPAVAPDGTVYFASNRPHDGVSPPATGRWVATLRAHRPQPDFDLYATRQAAGSWSAPQPVSSLNTSWNEGAPAVSPVGDFLYFSSDRPGGRGGYDLYRARRLGSEHAAPEPLGEPVNTRANELDPALGTDGFQLLFSSDRAAHSAGRYSLYTTRSREVYRDREPGPDRAGVMAFLRRVGLPVLLGLLLAALCLLLLALLKRLGNSRWQRRLSLLARCVLISLVVHALLVAAFTVWEVSASLAGLWRKQGVRVALSQAGARDHVVRQLRGEFTSFERPELPVSSASAPTPSPQHVMHPLLKKETPVELTGTTPAELRIEPAEFSSDRPPRVSPVAPPLELVARPFTTELPMPLVPSRSEAQAQEPLRLAETLAARTAPDPVPFRPAAIPPTEPADVDRPVALPPATQALPAPALDAVATGPAAVAIEMVDATTYGLPPVPLAAALPAAAKPDAVDAAPELAGDDEVSLEISATPAAVRPAPAAVRVDDAIARTFGAVALTPPSTLPLSRAADASPTRPEVVTAAATWLPGASLPEDRAATLAVQLPPVNQGTGTEAAPELTVAPVADLADALQDACLTAAAQPPMPVAGLHSHKRPHTPSISPATAPLPISVTVETAERLHSLRMDATAPAMSDLAPAPQLQPALPAPEARSSLASAGQVIGVVLDFEADAPIPSAAVRLDLADGHSVDVHTDEAGAYALKIPEVPEHFALSATADGYVPAAVNVAAADLAQGAVRVDFRLRRADLDTLTVEIEPLVHHLGDDAFEGAINSQFQMRAEGRRFVADFPLDAAPAGRGRASAQLSLLVKGAQMGHPVLVNGYLLPERLPISPSDGSFGKVRIEFPARLLVEGSNRLEIRGLRRGSDYDDFEFVNIQILLRP